MSKKTLHQQFLAASEHGDLPAQVQVAREAAVTLLNTSGLDQGEEFDQITALAGDFKPAGGSDAWDSYCQHLRAAYALGIAIGQLVHPDVFKAGAK